METTHTTTVQKIRSRKDNTAEHRRNIALLSATGLLDFIPISLYQLGVIKHLPDLPGKIFNSDKVNASGEAQVFGVADGPVSLAMYASNLALAALALKKKKRKNVFDYLLAANTIGQAAGGAYYLYTMLVKQRRICPYCVTGAVLNFATLIPLKKLFFNGKKLKE